MSAGGSTSDAGGGDWRTLLDREAWSKSPPLLATPCVKNAIGWGVSVGALIGAHKYFMYRQATRALNAAFLSAAWAAGLGFFFCTKDLEFNHRMVKESMEKSKIKEDPDGHRVGPRN